MTREEEQGRKSARYRNDYEKHKEEKRARSKAYYWENRDFILEKAAIYRKRKRKEANMMPKRFHRSIESKEQDLPWLLRQNIPRLREAFLKIPILQRPPYDVYLKLKTIEYYKEISQ